MKTKTAYRAKPQSEIIPQPDRPATIEPQHEPELNSEPTIQAEPKSDTPALDPKPAEPEESEATRRLKQQLAELERSAQLKQQAEELQRQQQQQRAAYADQVAQVFRWWQQNGLKPDDEQFLLAHPAAIGELTHFAGQEASKLGLEPNTAEHTERAKEIFHTHLRHLREQVAANAPMPETPAQGNPMDQPVIPPAPPGILDSIPPRPRQEARRSIVSAPVSRNGGPSGDYSAGLPTDPSKIRLTRDEVEAAKLSGISATEYARQKLRMLEAKSRGEIV